MPGSTGPAGDGTERATPVPPDETAAAAHTPATENPTIAKENGGTPENIEPAPPPATTHSVPTAQRAETSGRVEPAEPAAPTDPATPAGTLTAVGTAEKDGTTPPVATEQPASGAAATGYGAPISAGRIPDSPGAKATAVDPSSDAELWGPGSRIPVQPTGIHRASEYPAPPVVLPRRQLVAYPAGVLPAAGFAGLVAAATVPLDRPGIGWLLAGSAAAAAVGTVHRRARRDAGRGDGRIWNRERVWWAIAAPALLAVGTFRAAGWLFVLCVAAAVVAGSLAVVGRRSERGIFRDALAVPLASAGAVGWVYTALGKRPGGAGARNRRLGISAAVTMALLAIFVPLLAGADATFAALVDGLVPRLDSDSLTRWVVVFVLAGAGTLGALYLLAGPPLPADGRAKAANRTLARLEWGLPVGALTAVFALFLGAQLVALFGGDDYVQRTAGLTYAEYARSGFWQLSAVTVLTLAVILPVLHRAARDTAADRLWLRGLLCAISGLTLVMIASAFGRMWTYQQAYGFTVLRLLVGTCELWLGIVYVLVMIAVLRLETAWLPRSAIATATAALLALAALNPEGLVAAENIDRWERGENLDVGYLAGLSADIVPVLDRMPAPIRDDLLGSLEHRLDDDTWNSWNLARHRAR